MRLPETLGHSPGVYFYHVSRLFFALLTLALLYSSNKMMWQDTVIAICQLAFLPSMIPTIIGKDKPAFLTSFFNAIIVGIITFTFVTLGLWFSVLTGALTASIWAILAIQKYSMDKKITVKKPLES